jgi:hypothetical protein
MQSSTLTSTSSHAVKQLSPLNLPRYEKVHDFDQVAHDFKVIKMNNHITEAWPTRLKLEREQNGSQEKFNVLLGSDLTGVEHYVEWQRTD